MRDNDATLLVRYEVAAEIVGGVDRLNEHIVAGRLKPIPLNDRPGAPSMFPAFSRGTTGAEVKRDARRE